MVTWHGYVSRAYSRVGQRQLWGIMLSDTTWPVASFWLAGETLVGCVQEWQTPGRQMSTDNGGKVRLLSKQRSPSSWCIRRTMHGLYLQRVREVGFGHLSCVPVRNLSLFCFQKIGVWFRYLQFGLSSKKLAGARGTIIYIRKTLTRRNFSL